MCWNRGGIFHGRRDFAYISIYLQINQNLSQCDINARHRLKGEGREGRGGKEGKECQNLEHFEELTFNSPK